MKFRLNPAISFFNNDKSKPNSQETRKIYINYDESNSIEDVTSHDLQADRGSNPQELSDGADRISENVSLPEKNEKLLEDHSNKDQEEEGGNDNISIKNKKPEYQQTIDTKKNKTNIIEEETHREISIENHELKQENYNKKSNDYQEEIMKPSLVNFVTSYNLRVKKTVTFQELSDSENEVSENVCLPVKNENLPRNSVQKRNKPHAEESKKSSQKPQKVHQDKRKTSVLTHSNVWAELNIDINNPNIDLEFDAFEKRHTMEIFNLIDDLNKPYKPKKPSIYKQLLERTKDEINENKSSAQKTGKTHDNIATVPNITKKTTGYNYFSTPFQQIIAVDKASKNPLKHSPPATSLANRHSPYGIRNIEPKTATDEYDKDNIKHIFDNENTQPWTKYDQDCLEKLLDKHNKILFTDSEKQTLREMHSRLTRLINEHNKRQTNPEIDKDFYRNNEQIQLYKQNQYDIKFACTIRRQYLFPWTQPRKNYR